MSGRFNTFTKRFTVLRGRFLYFFKSEKDQRTGKTKQVHFIQGWFIEKLKPSALINEAHLIDRGFRLIPPRGTSQNPRVLFAQDKYKAADWIHSLQVAAQTVQISHSYSLGEKLGSGAFSVVRRAKRK